nr:MAG TPA: hypothetical protein [Caudoviricetes sp.]
MVINLYYTKYFQKNTIITKIKIYIIFFNI